MLAEKLLKPPSAVANYIEDVFSTYLYTGTGANQTITNGIDLAGKGGVVWVKSRSNATNNVITDTAHGLGYFTNTTDPQSSIDITSYTSSGFNIRSSFGNVDTNGYTYASWTFRKQPKFFDVVTYDGDGSTSLTISHNLGSTPACIFFKCATNTGTSWVVYHKDIGTSKYLLLQSTTAAATDLPNWISVSSTSFTLNTNWGSLNGNVRTYVAYIFASNAGGFGLTGTDNVISCGSYTGSGAGTASVTLGYEPQWVMVKNASNAANWNILDNMRGLSYSGSALLRANTADAEASASARLYANATGFQVTPNVANDTQWDQSGDTYIYIAIRRGPMKVPTDATKVFSALTRTGSGANVTINATLSPVDIAWIRNTDGTAGFSFAMEDRLRGSLANIYTDNSNGSTGNSGTFTGWDVQNGYTLGADTSGYGFNTSGWPFLNLAFQRAPSYADVVCYTGAGGVSSISHNLTVTPELIIVKCTSTTGEWFAWHSSFPYNKYMFFNRSDAAYTAPSGSEYFGSSAPVATSTTFKVGPNSDTNGSNKFVAHLFATCPGVSKVGSYTGNGSTQTINCGFTGGARFVMIKQVGGATDWWVWNTASGMVTGNDKRNAVNNANSQSNSDYVFTSSTGFDLVTSNSAVNANAATYIYLAIA